MTSPTTDLKAGRLRVSRSRGALSGVLLIVLGAWAALVPFIGPYFDFAFTPNPDDAWHWTSSRGWLEVLPGGVTVLGGLLLLVGASRVTTLLGGWLAAAGGAWLVVGPPLADQVDLSLGTPDASSQGVRVLEALLYFYAVGAAILLVGGIALGRLSVHSVADVRAADRRAAADERRAEDERRAAAAQHRAAETYPQRGDENYPQRGDENYPQRGGDNDPQRGSGNDPSRGDHPPTDQRTDAAGGYPPPPDGEVSGAHHVTGQHAADQRTGDAPEGDPEYRPPTNY